MTGHTLGVLASRKDARRPSPSDLKQSIFGLRESDGAHLRDARRFITIGQTLKPVVGTHLIQYSERNEQHSVWIV